MDCGPYGQVGQGCLFPIVGIGRLMQALDRLLPLRFGVPAFQIGGALTGQRVDDGLAEFSGLLNDRLPRSRRCVEGGENLRE